MPDVLMNKKNENEIPNQNQNVAIKTVAAWEKILIRSLLLYFEAFDSSSVFLLIETLLFGRLSRRMDAVLLA
jgi:hypothetical protein